MTDEPPGRAHDVWSVPLPERAEPPFTVFVNGLPKEEGPDYIVEGRWLQFRTPLQPKIRLGLRQQLSLLVGIGVYKDLKADVVDLAYQVGGAPRSASALTIIPPQDPLKDA